MHPSLNSADIIECVLKHVNADWIGLFGSAADDGAQFNSQSDIDVVALHGGRNQFFFTELRGRKVELMVFSQNGVKDVYEHAEWFDTQWLWHLVKFEASESLHGVRPNYEVTPKQRLISVLGMIGPVLGTRKKQAESRTMANNDSELRLLNLRHLIDKTLPLSCDALTESIDLDYVDRGRSWLEPVFREHLNDVLFFPQHFLAADWLNARWDLGLRIPSAGTPF